MLCLRLQCVWKTMPDMYVPSYFIPQACQADTAVRGGSSAESHCPVPKQLVASAVQAKAAPANVQKADLLGPSYAGMNSTATGQQLRPTQHGDGDRPWAQNGDKAWMVPSTSGARSGVMNAGPPPDKYGRLTSRSYLPAPPPMPTFNQAAFEQAASRRCDPENTPAAIETTPAIYGGRSRWAAVKVVRLVDLSLGWT